MLNSVKLIGFVAKPPRRIGDQFFFPLAVYRDPHRAGDDEGESNGSEKKREVPDFPHVIVVTHTLPPFVKHRSKIRVEGWLRTRNRSEPLPRRVLKDLKRGGVGEEQARELVGHLPPDVLVKTTEVEVVAERILKEA